MTWVGGVKRHCPFFSKPSHWCEQVKAEGMGVALALLEHVMADEGEAHARNALQALVRRGGDGSKTDLAGVEGKGPEGAHGSR